MGWIEIRQETYYKFVVFRLGDREGEWRTLGWIGRIQQRIGQIQQARTLYEQALEIVQDIGDRGGEGESLNDIGFMYFRQGQYPPALDYYQRSLAIRKEIGDRHGKGVMLNNIGGIYIVRANTHRPWTTFSDRW